MSKEAGAFASRHSPSDLSDDSSRRSSQPSNSSGVSPHPSLNVEDRLPVLFLQDSPAGGGAPSPGFRRRPLIAFPRGASLPETEIPWIGLFQSLDMRLGRILDSLGRLSRGEPLFLPEVLPVRLSEVAATFPSEGALAAGTTGRLIIELPTLPVGEIDCMLTIVSSEPLSSGEFLVTGLWNGLEGEMHETLLQYLILRQREILAFRSHVIPS
ncbi:MAG: hypothetical protein ACYDBP_11345 [Leptospirales bacterium]